MTSIILNGANGKMGKTIIETAKKYSDRFEIVRAIDFNCFSEYENSNNIKIEKNFSYDMSADCVIDFSHPNALDSVLNFSKTKNIPVVIATTGYSENQIELIKKTALKIPIFFTFNMSIGINLLIDLIKKSYCVLGTDFDIEIVEKHHNEKIDAPSGTAIMLANAINEEASGFYKYIYNRQDVRQKREKNEIGIHSIRAGSIVGEHEVIFGGNDETITISHTASSKKIFATGALNAANFIKNKKPGLYNMKDLIAKI